MKKAVLLTDGDCGFCQQSVKFLERKFPGSWENRPSSTFEFGNFELTEIDAQSRVWLIVPDGTTFKNYGGAQAVAKLLLIQPKLLIKPFAILAFVPVFKQVADLLYIWIANNRHRFNGNDLKCGSD